MSFINDGGNEDMKFLFGAFGIGDNDDHLVVNDDGTIDFTADNEEFKNGVTYFNDLYNKNLIDVEAFEQDWNAYVAKGKKNCSACISHGTKLMSPERTIPTSRFRHWLVRAEKNTLRVRIGSGFSRDRFVITSANKNLELTAKSGRSNVRADPICAEQLGHLRR